jgi:hypothetical protein
MYRDTYQAAKSDTAKGEDISGERRWSHYTEAYLSTHQRLYLPKYKLIPNTVSCEYPPVNIEVTYITLRNIMENFKIISSTL